MSRQPDRCLDSEITTEIRITFFREKDDLGFNYYKFAGVFEIDKAESLKLKKCVWVKISDEYTI